MRTQSKTFHNKAFRALLSTLLENLILYPKLQFFRKSNEIVNLNFRAKN